MSFIEITGGDLFGFGIGYLYYIDFVDWVYLLMVVVELFEGVEFVDVELFVCGVSEYSLNEVGFVMRVNG